VRPEYKILSERLIQEVIDRAAKTGFRPQDVQLRPPFTGATFGRATEEKNWHVLAERVEQALYDQTGTPEFPGEYIGLRGSFDGWTFMFDYERAKVAWLAAEDEGRLVVLCTSARNIVGYDAPAQVEGWRPSDAGGLREVVMALRGQGNPTRLPERISHPHRSTLDMQRSLESNAWALPAPSAQPLTSQTVARLSLPCS
jgi:hypothetical protein